MNQYIVMSLHDFEQHADFMREATKSMSGTPDELARRVARACADDEGTAMVILTLAPGSLEGPTHGLSVPRPKFKRVS